MRRYGDVQADRPIRGYNLTGPRPNVRYKGATEADRFWNRVDKTSGCWHWRGSVMNSGYGQAIFGGFSKCAHRIAWEMQNGERPDGHRIVQSCGNRLCVRPNHLRLVEGATSMSEVGQ